jgi:putative endonuclease
MGRKAEQAVQDAMASEGWMPLACRARTRWGEIDLVMRRGRTVAFVEVKAASDAATLGERLDQRTQHRVRRAAVAWIAVNGSMLIGVHQFRFDAGLVSLHEGDIQAIELITSAF